jgi:glycerol-3-phosphate acyltransferase PlsY
LIGEPGPLLLACLIGYVLGAIPFGVYISRAFGIDILKVGSGNIGATNVYRVMGAKAALPVLILDIAKGLVPSLLALYVFNLPSDGALLAGIAAVLGHCLSPFLGFKGGKGIATTLGAALGVVPFVALSALGVFLLLFAITRYVSLSSMLAMASTLIWGFVFGATTFQFGIYIALTLFVIIRHKSNIQRLLKGEEPKFNGKKKAEAPVVDQQEVRT